METAELTPGALIPRVIRGNWQLAGGHGSVDREAAIADLFAYADAGITAFDCADIYTGVEAIIGQFRERYRNERGAEALAQIRVHTKFVPDLDRLQTIDRAYVEGVIDRSLERLKAERLDLVQFHWWDYAAPRWIEVAGWLTELKAAGKIRDLGGTNFDAPRTAAMLEAGVPLVSMQVQYSLLDRRPERALLPLAQGRDVRFLAYGTVAGGYLSDRWLGIDEPREPFENRSLVKYKLMIDEWGGWALFQRLLETLRGIADRHGTDIATVASRWALDRPNVAAVIVGARDRSHLPANLAIAALKLDTTDRAAIDVILAEAQVPPGDVYALERDREGPHGRIMHYSNNAKRA